MSVCMLSFLGAFSSVLKECVECFNYIESVFLILLLVGQLVEYIFQHIL
jgi:hypothetical protein